MSYTAQEKFKFVLWLAECNQGYAVFAIRTRRELRRNVKVPDRKSVLKWRTKLLETGSAEREKVEKSELNLFSVLNN